MNLERLLSVTFTHLPRQSWTQAFINGLSDTTYAIRVQIDGHVLRVDSSGSNKIWALPF